MSAFTGLLGVEDSKDLLRVYDALQHLPQDVQDRTLSAATQQLAAGWVEELNARPGYSEPTKAVITANPTTVAHTLGLTVATGGSGDLAELTRPFEFGTLSPDRTTTYRRKNRSGTGSHTVTRRAQRQIPPRSTGGWVAYPAAGKWSTRAFKMFMQIIVKTAHDAIDGGRR